MNKQITFSQIKEVFNSTNNNEFANELAYLIVSLKDELANGTESQRKYADVLKHKSDKLYNLLDSVGFYDDVK